MALHARKVSAAARAAEDADRQRKIRASRIEVNAREFRRFKLSGFCKVWEAVNRKPMPRPDLELEPAAFLEWLMLDEGWQAPTRLEDALRIHVEKQEALDRRRARVTRGLRSRFASRKRAARMMQATPPWADRQAIRDVYAQCRAMNHLDGQIAYHVDHYYPLQGETVSGLHVVENLRIITAQDNRAKKNKMPLDDNLNICYMLLQ